MRKLLIIMLVMLIALFFIACPEPVAKYNLTVNIAGTGTVALNPNGGTYDAGTVVTLTANPDSNYTFTGWSGDLSGSTNPTTITMDSDKTITATFTEKITQYTLTVTIVGNGSVTANGSAVTTAVPINYNENTVVTLTTTPVSSWQFDGWSGTNASDITGNQITMNGNKSITATFTEQTMPTYTLTVTFTNGTVTANGTALTSGVAATFNAGTSVSLQATPSANYTFTSWSGSLTSTINPATITMNGNKTITATFTEIVTYSLTVTFTNGTVTANGTALTSGVAATFNAGTSVSLQATPSANYIFTSWSGSLTGSTNPATITMNGNKTITATFTPAVNYSLTVTFANGTVTANGTALTSGVAVSYPSGTSVILEATPSAGYNFSSWSGSLTGSTNPETITMNGNKTISAIFVDPTSTNEWLIMMYMGGDTNLEAAMWGDVNEVELGLYNLNSTVREKIKVILLWDGSATNSGSGYTSACPSGSVLYEMGPESTQNTSISSNTINKSSSASWLASGEVNMADGTVLTNFLNWCNTNYPGYTNHMLILSDHGGGQRSGGRAAVWDDGNGGFTNVIYTMELQQALSNAGYSSSNKLAILGFDACLMAGVEEAYQHRNVAQYMVASLESEQGDGWEYQHWIPQMTLGMTPAQLGTILVQSYKTNFDPDTYNDQTMSCTDLSKMDTLKTKIDALVAAIVANSQQSNAKTQFGSSQTFEGTYTYLIEVGSFASKVRSLTGLTTAADEVIAAMADAIVYSWADTNSGNYYGAGSTTKKGLHICGKTSGNDGGSANIFPSWYTTTNLDFATTGSTGVDTWAELLDYWY